METMFLLILAGFLLALILFVLVILLLLRPSRNRLSAKHSSEDMLKIKRQIIDAPSKRKK